MEEWPPLYSFHVVKMDDSKNLNFTSPNSPSPLELEFSVLRTEDPNAVKESSLSGPLELEKLPQMVQDLLLEGIRVGKTYTEHIERVPIGPNMVREIHSFTLNPMPDEDELSDEEWIEAFRDADVRIEAADPEHPDNGQCRVTFLPEGVTVDVDLFSETQSFRIGPENRNRVLRKRTTFRDYGEMAFERVEAYLEGMRDNPK